MVVFSHAVEGLGRAYPENPRRESPLLSQLACFQQVLVF